MKHIYLQWQQKLKTHKTFRWFWTFCGIYLILPYGLLVPHLLLNPERRLVFVQCALAFLLGRGAIGTLLHFFVRAPRPYQKYGFSPAVESKLFSVRSETPGSFPSGHTIALASVAGILLQQYPTLGVVALLGSALVGTARVVLGYHFPRDIFAGLALGSLSAWVILLFT